MRKMTTALYLLIFLLLGSIGKSIGASELFYWAGHQATMKDRDGNTLRIKFSKNGREYHVDWNYWDEPTERGVCSGSVSDEGVLEEINCIPESRVRDRSICGTVLKIDELCDYDGI